MLHMTLLAQAIQADREREFRNRRPRVAGVPSGLRHPRQDLELREPAISRRTTTVDRRCRARRLPVTGDGLGRRRRDLRPQLGRLQHLDAPPSARQAAGHLAGPVEGHPDPAPGVRIRIRLLDRRREHRGRR